LTFDERVALHRVVGPERIRATNGAPPQRLDLETEPGTDSTSAACECRGTSLIRKRPPPKDRHRALGIVLL